MVKKAKKGTKIKEVAAKVDNKSKKNSKKNLNFFKKILNYFKEMKSELKKVAWPSRKEILKGTLTVFVMVIIVMSVVVLSDFIFNRLLRILLGLN